MSSRYDVACKRDGANGSARLLVTVTDTTTGVVADPVQVNRATLGEDVRRLTALMELEGAKAEDLERQLAAELEGTPEFQPVALGDLWAKDKNLRDPVIDGLLRRGQVGNLISASKSYKTYLILNLAIATALGRTWLERFPTAGGKVLLIDLELQAPDITRRTHDIVQAMHVPPADAARLVEVVSLRGRAVSIEHIERWLLSVAPRTYSLVIIDPLYKVYPPDFDENSNPKMTDLYRRFERIAEHLDAGLMVVHHASKGSQADKSVVDVGAGAGAQARSPDAHIAIRQHEADDAVVFDARVRSFQPVDPLVLAWKYPLWERDLSLDPTQLRTGRRSQNREKPQPEPKPEKKVWDVSTFAAAFLTAEPQTEDAILVAAGREKLSATLAKRLLRTAEEQRAAHRWSFGPKSKAKYATEPQPVTQTTEGGV